MRRRALMIFLLLASFAAAASAEEPDAILRGQVFGPDGEPLAGAAVHACTVEEVLYGSTDDEGPPCEDEAAVTTDDEGGFVLHLPRPSWYEIRARHPGLVDGVASRVRAAPGDGNEPLKLRLRRGTVVTGRVVDEAGEPVAGVEIQGWTGAGLARTVSGGDGSFQLEGMGAGRGGIRAEAPGYWMGSTFLQVEDGGEPKELDLPISLQKIPPGEEPDPDDEGLVFVPADYDPPGDVKVTGIFRDLEPGEIPNIVITRGLWPRRATLELDGGWWVEGLSPGTWTVEAYLGRGIDAPSFSKTFEIPPGVTEMHLELSFGDGREAEEAPSKSLGSRGLPPPDLTPPTPLSHLPPNHRERGELALPRLSPLSLGRGAGGEGLWTGGGAPLPVGGVGDGRGVGGEVGRAVAADTPIQVQVADPAGAPFPGAWLTVGERLHLNPSKSGRFRFTVPPGTHEITAHAWGQPPARITVTASGRPLDLEIRFPVPGMISGRVTGPASGEEAAVWARNEHGDFLPRIEVTEEGGRFELSPAGPGTWTVIVHTGQRSLERRVRLEAGGRAAVDFHFPSLPEIRGRVLDSGGKPAAGAEVTFSRGPGQPAVEATAGENGRFAVRLVDGSYRMWASQPGSGPSPDLPLTVAGAPVDGLALRLSPMAMVTGRVHGLRPGEEVRPVWAERPSEAGRVWGHWSPEHGLTIFSLGPGDWIVSAQVGDRAVSAPVRIPSGTERVAVDLKVPRGSARLEGTVAGWTREKGFWVAARRVDPPRLEVSAALERTDAFSFGELPPGRYRLRAGAEGKVLVERIVQVPGKPVVLRPGQADP